tara:strand:+ start:1635 stop:1952 length:318 start_codon:yes stop_codon:yes gene_type:complete
MISSERDREYQEKLSFLEYHASFINSEAVKDIRNRRDQEDLGNFMDDEEFDNFVRDGLFRDSAEKIDNFRNKDTNLDDYNADRKKDARNARVPKNLSSVIKLTEN